MLQLGSALCQVSRCIPRERVAYSFCALCDMVCYVLCIPCDGLYQHIHECVSHSRPSVALSFNTLASEPNHKLVPPL